MHKSKLSGIVVAPLICATYVGVVVILLGRLGIAAGMTGGDLSDFQINPLGYYIAAIVGIFGGLVLVGIVYRLDGVFWKATPEWFYLILALGVPYAIYWLIPP
jgi:hypothetical protein